MTRNVHHAIAEHATAEHARAGNKYQRAELGCPRPYGRIQKVHRIIAHTYPKVERGKNEEEYDHSQIHPFHTDLLFCELNSYLFTGAKVRA